MEKKIEAVLATSSPPACNAQLLSVAEAMREACAKAIWHRSSADEAARLVRKIDAAAIIAALPAAAPQVVADERALFEAYVRKVCHMPTDARVNWDAEWTKYSWDTWQARAALAAAPVQAQEPFAYMIVDESGEAYFGEFCVASGKTDLEAELEGLNYGQDGEPYKIVPVFRAPVQPVAVPDGDPLRKALNLCIRIIHGGRGVKEIAWNLHRDIELALLSATAAQGDAKELTDDQIKEVAINYASHVAGDVYDVTKYDCAEDFFNCVRAAIAAKAAS